MRVGTRSLVGSAIGVLLVFGASRVAAQAEAEITAARGSMREAAQAVANGARAVERQTERWAELDAELADAQGELDALIVEKARALHELALGMYCSQCGRPKSQVERETGKSFAQHLVDVSGHAIPADAERLRRKREEYDRKIGRMETNVANLRDRRDGAAEALQAGRTQATVSAMDYIAAADRWQGLLARRSQIAELVRERDLVATESDVAQRRAELSDVLRRLEEPGDPDGARSLEHSVGQAQQGLRDAVDRLAQLARQQEQERARDVAEQREERDARAGLDRQTASDYESATGQASWWGGAGAGAAVLTGSGSGQGTADVDTVASTIASVRQELDRSSEVLEGSRAGSRTVRQQLLRQRDRMVERLVSAGVWWDDLREQGRDRLAGAFEGATKSVLDDLLTGRGLDVDDFVEDLASAIAPADPVRSVDDFVDLAKRRFYERLDDVRRQVTARLTTGRDFDELDPLDREFQEVAIGTEFGELLYSWTRVRVSPTAVVDKFDAWQTGVFDWIGSKFHSLGDDGGGDR